MFKKIISIAYLVACTVYLSTAEIPCKDKTNDHTSASYWRFNWLRKAPDEGRNNKENVLKMIEKQQQSIKQKDEDLIEKNKKIKEQKAEIEVLKEDKKNFLGKTLLKLVAYNGSINKGFETIKLQRAALQAQEKKLTKLHGQITSLQNEKKQLQNKLRKKQKARKTKAVKDLANQISGLQKQLTNEKDELKAKTQTIANQDTCISSLRQKLQGKKKILKVKTQTIIQQDTKIQKQVTMISKLKRENDNLQKALQKQEDAMAGVLAEKKQVEEKVTQMKHEAADKKEENLLLQSLRQLVANEALFQQKLKENRCEGGDWYQETMLKDLVSIRHTYPFMERKDKKTALAISRGLATLPDYDGVEFYVNVAYWSYRLYDLQKSLAPGVSQELFCSLKATLAYDANKCCPYHGKQVLPLPAPDSTLNNPNWKQRFTYANKGWHHHKVKSNNPPALQRYKKVIQEQMEGLKQSFPKLQASKHKKEALSLFIKLSAMHRFEHFDFLIHYITIQHRLWELSVAVSDTGKSSVYNGMQGASYAAVASNSGNFGVVYNEPWALYMVVGWTHGMPGGSLRASA